MSYEPHSPRAGLLPFSILAGVPLSTALFPWLSGPNPSQNRKQNLLVPRMRKGPSCNWWIRLGPKPGFLQPIATATKPRLPIFQRAGNRSRASASASSSFAGGRKKSPAVLPPRVPGLESPFGKTLLVVNSNGWRLFLGHPLGK